MGKTHLKLGIMRLTDCAPLVIAKERGFFASEGVHVELVREASWATVRDKVAAGVLDGAQMLAAMPLAASLGLGGISRAVIAPLSLDLNGNAVTISNDLFQQIAGLTSGGNPDAMGTANALKQLIDAGKQKERAPYTFATVFPFSTHNYELRYWLAAAGINPDEDLNLITIPPPQMVSQLEAGKIDGFCVGEPWNSLAVQRGAGVMAVTNYEIWNNAPEKVFAVNRDWAEAHPETLQAVIRALIRSGRWLDDPAHRLEAVHVIAGESYIGAPTEALIPSMTGYYVRHRGLPAQPFADFNVFHRYAASFPWRSHAVWLVTQMYRWGQINTPLEIRKVAERVYRPDLYRQAASAAGVSVPPSDYKPEGIHAQAWETGGTTSPIAMGPDCFVDGAIFDSDRIVNYLDRQKIKNLRVSLDALAQFNQ